MRETVVPEAPIKPRPYRHRGPQGRPRLPVGILIVVTLVLVACVDMFPYLAPVRARSGGAAPPAGISSEAERGAGGG